MERIIFAYSTEGIIHQEYIKDVGIGEWGVLTLTYYKKYLRTRGISDSIALALHMPHNFAALAHAVNSEQFGYMLQILKKNLYIGEESVHYAIVYGPLYKPVKGMKRDECKMVQDTISRAVVSTRENRERILKDEKSIDIVVEKILGNIRVYRGSSRHSLIPLKREF